MPKSNNAKTPYLPSQTERIFTLFIASSIVVGGGYLVIRNKPFSDGTLVVIARLLLSFAVAVLGATLPGFLRFGWDVKGITVRAGGAMALFAFTYFITPNVSPSFNAQTSGQVNAHPNINPVLSETHPDSNNRPPTINCNLQNVKQVITKSHESSLKVLSVVSGECNGLGGYFDIHLENSTTDKRRLQTFLVFWKFIPGNLKGQEEGYSLKPTEKYSIGLNLNDTMADMILKKEEPIHPPYLIPPGNSKQSTDAAFRLNVYYTFENITKPFHIGKGWDVHYEISIIDDLGKNVLTITRSWNQGDIDKL